MLKKIYVKNFAIIDELTLEFSPQLNLITGETGAGKSILVGALSLLLGQKVDTKALFRSNSKCIVEGLFAVKDYAMEDIFQAHELDYADETYLRREINTDGKSRAFINDSPVPLATLEELGSRLIDIHSQHETLDINQESFQMRVMDSVGDQMAVFTHYRKLLAAFKKKEKLIQQLEKNQDKARAEFDFISFQVEELSAAQLSDPLEQPQLEKELLELTHAEEILKALQQFSTWMGEDEHSVLEALRNSLAAIHPAERFYPPLQGIVERIKACQIELKDVYREVESMAGLVSVNSPRMESVQARLNVLYGLEQKHRVADLAQLLTVYDGLKMQIASLVSQDSELSTLKIEQVENRNQVHALATQLAVGRKKVLQTVEKEVRDCLGELAMKDADFQIQLISSVDEFTPFGFDRVRFLFSANKGHGAQDISKIASGGELSRLVLAVKALSAKYIPMPTLLFDEIDTGVSGEVAMRVGRVMKRLSVKNQVIAITHLPQIASREGFHFRVHKEVVEGIVRTRIDPLFGAHRVAEIAKMLSGNDPGEFAVKNAQELLQSP